MIDWVGLSIRQPWIDLILKGIKTIEVRDWKITRVGPILLHASMTIDWQAIELFGYSNPWSLPRGCLVGSAEIAETFSFTMESWQATAEKHLVIRPLKVGDYGSILKNVRPFQQLIACPGKLFFFPIPPKILERVREQLSAHRTL
jgi:hypothetical protein